MELSAALSIDFEAPLRLKGRVPRGSQLRHASNLRKLLTWAQPDQKPHLAVVLVDSDGDPALLSTMRGLIGTRPEPQPEVIIGVAEHEFESWLIADERVLRDQLGYARESLPESRKLRPREAKELIAELMSKRSADLVEQKRLRLAMASNMDLQRVSDRCPSFETLRSELRDFAKRNP